MNKKKGLIIGVIIIVFLFEVLTGYISKLLLVALTGVGDSDDLDIMMGVSNEYNMTVIQTATVYNNLPLVFNNEVFSTAYRKGNRRLLTLPPLEKQKMKSVHMHSSSYRQ